MERVGCQFYEKSKTNLRKFFSIKTSALLFKNAKYNYLKYPCPGKILYALLVSGDTSLANDEDNLI